MKDFGAFVDINSENDGMVRSNLLPEPEGKTGPFATNDIVTAVFPEDNEWYTAVVTKTLKDGTFEVKWDDPDGGPETSTVVEANMKHFVPKFAVEEGDEVDVWIQGIRDGKISLSMVPPLDFDAIQKNLNPEEWLD